MIQSLKKRLQNQEDGFTLVELLVVIVILGILAAIVVLAVGGITNKGQESAKATDKRTLEAAEEAFFAKNLVDPAFYATEQGLKDDKMLRTLSEKYDICLAKAAPLAVPPILAKGNYEIVVQGVACSTGFSPDGLG
jgi:prepilin-type N-terminal cleavage/methylation domain-containing protein